MTGPGLVPLVRRWWWLLLAGALIGGLTAWVVASSATKSYQADAKLLVGPVSGDYPTLQAAGALGRTYAELAHSRRIVAAAARDTGVKLSPKQLEDTVTATSNDVTRIVDVSARYEDPRAAARLAGAVARQLMDLRAKAPISDVDPVDAIMRDPTLNALTAADLALVRKAAVHALGSSNPGEIEMIQGPVPPQGPASPRVGLLAFLGALAGLLLAGIYALMRESAAADDGYEDFVFDEFPPVSNGSAQPEDAASALEEAGRRRE
jgi:uncharacterized protein involved in exopolysaccharide biosynthesis